MKKYFSFLVILCGIGLGYNLFAQSSQYSFEYPELLVSPKASERINAEASIEKQMQFLVHWPLQLSAIATIVAAAMVQDTESSDKESPNDPNNAAKTAYIIGGGWLLVTTGMSIFYTPYQNAQNYLKTLPTKTKQDLLIKERIAEEYLSFNSSLGLKLKIISTLTNLAAGVVVAKSTKDDNAKIAGGIAAAVAFLPWFFPYRWEYVYSYHKEYKRKIYGPVSQTSLMFDKNKKTLSPMLTISWDL